MEINAFYKELDSQLRNEMTGIIWARHLFETKDDTVNGKREHTERALQRRQAILHAIYRFGYITSNTANKLLLHSTRNNTATFLTQMVKEGLLRRYEVKNDYKYVYLIRKPLGLDLLKKTLESVNLDGDITYEVDASKIGIGESIYHHELISELAIRHAQIGDNFVLEHEIKMAAVNGNLKVTPLALFSAIEF
jgi:membrane carboxypeptidase/penicillin-binding protein